MQTKTLRPYQKEASEAILESWRKYRTVMCSLATGGGKTLIAASTANKVKSSGRVLFLANRNELCQQPFGVFTEQCGLVPGLEKAETKASLDKPIVIGSVQTISRKPRLERFPKDHFSYIFCDEAHGAASESWKRILGHFIEAHVCGITATPFRADAKSLTDIFEYEAFRKGLFDLVDEGFLVSPDHVDKLSTAISLANVRVKHTTEGRDYDMQDAHDAILPYFEEIAKELVARHSERHILAFLPLVVSSQKFVAACVKAGLNAVHIDGEDPDRDAKLRAFKDGRIQLLSNSNLLHTGIDAPICDATLNLRPTRSKVLYMQIVGRSTRTVPGLIDGIEDPSERLCAIANSAKPMAFIIDPMWQTLDHDLVCPSFLVAKNQEDAEAINKRASGSYSLRGLNQQVVEEREEAMRRFFERAAKFRSGKVDARYFAASVKDKILSAYEPALKWELQPVSYTTKRLLAARGIDPETVQTEGEARQFVRAINRRRYRGLAEIHDLGPAVDRGLAPAVLWALSREQARKLKPCVVPN